MNHSTHCKFCHKPITVEVDDDYAKLGDPYKLLKKATCNACADVRVIKRVLEERISRLSTTYSAMHRPSDATKLTIRKNLTRLLEDYAKMISRWHKVDGMAFDEGCVDDVMLRPEKWAAVLTGLWKMFREWQGKEKEKQLL